METDSASTFNAKPPPLNSDQLNYLIWRYLQESGYAEAAVKLQRDWKVDADSLPFAKSVKGHALVTLVQKGLRYHHLSLTIDENGRPSKQLNPSMFFFGPESERPPAELPEEPLPAAPSPNDLSSAPQKQFRDIAINGIAERTSPAALTPPAPKRGRKTAANSERNGNVAGKPASATPRGINASAMDVDMVNGHVSSVPDARSPSAVEPGYDEVIPHVNGFKVDERIEVDEQSPMADHQNQDPLVESVPPLIHTLFTGESIGIQVAPAKVANLAQSTTVLNLSSLESPGNSKLVTRISWQPGERKVLAVLGDDFCGLWDVAGEISNSRTPPFQELIQASQGELTSAMGWGPNGDALAVATYSDQTGDIFLFDGQDLSMMENLTASQRAMTGLLWHRNGSMLYGIAPYNSEATDDPANSGSSVVRWNLTNLAGITQPLTLLVPEIMMDADSAFSEDSGIVCTAGQNTIYCCRTSPDFGIEQKWSSSSTTNDQWTFVRCAWRGGTSAMLIAASAENATLWMPAQNLFRRAVHDAPITGLELRPQLSQIFSLVQKPEFATSSMDGTIKVWQYDENLGSLQSLRKLIIGHGSPVMALAYSPDGFCLAGASYDVVRIWNAEHGHSHMATWKDEENLWNGARLKDDDMISLGGRSSMNGDSPQLAVDHALAWDSDSRRLAFGLGSQVAIINFQR